MAADGERLSTDAFDLYFWEPSVSPHKTALLDQLSRCPAVSSVRYIADGELSKERQNQGWTASIPNSFEMTVAPDKQAIKQIVHESSHESIHLFSGIRHFRCLTEGLAAVCISGRRFGLMSEPRASEGLKGLARYTESWLTEGRLRRTANFVLAIGANGPSWYQGTGYRPDNIFPFAYFLPNFERTDSPSNTSRTNHPVRIAFIGRLIREKGILLFLEAVRLLPFAAEAHVVGVGQEIEAVRASASCGSITYHGAIPMGDVPAFLRSIDILVLPSLTTDDGWGAVVSEALLAGAAVVTSRKVGASVCIDNSNRGRLMQELTPQALASEILWLVKNDRLTDELRNLRSNWAEERLTDRAGARYLVAILEHLYSQKPKPLPFYE